MNDHLDHYLDNIDDYLYFFPMDPMEDPETCGLICQERCRCIAMDWRCYCLPRQVTLTSCAFLDKCLRPLPSDAARKAFLSHLFNDDRIVTVIHDQWRKFRYFAYVQRGLERGIGAFRALHRFDAGVIKARVVAFAAGFALMSPDEQAFKLSSLW